MYLELKNGKRRHFPDAIAKVLLKKGIGKVATEVEDEPTVHPSYDQKYSTRMLQANAPYGLKADGTPRKRPGRVAKSA